MSCEWHLGHSRSQMATSWYDTSRDPGQRSWNRGLIGNHACRGIKPKSHRDLRKLQSSMRNRVPDCRNSCNRHEDVSDSDSRHAPAKADELVITVVAAIEANQRAIQRRPLSVFLGRTNVAGFALRAFPFLARRIDVRHESEIQFAVVG